MKHHRVQLLRYLTGSRANKTRSAAALVEDYLQKDAYSRHASKLPVSQRYYYENQKSKQDAATSRRGHRWCSQTTQGNAFRESNADSLSSKPTSIQLRLGAAQILTSSRQQCITNHGETFPLYFAQTNPRVAGLCVPLVTMLRRLGIRQLTELQGALVPLFLKGTHLIAHAETGTGKSFGIALAIANRILRDNINYRLHTVVVVPTEELALQYDKWLRHFAGCSLQIVQVAIDSIPLDVQLARLHNMSPHVLVGTPQRLADVTRLSPNILGEKLRRKVDCVVMDEADVVLDTALVYGRQTGVRGSYLIDRIFRSHREEVPAQLVAVSATVDGNTARMLNNWTRNDRAVRLTTSFVEHSIPSTISFYFFASSAACSPARLLALTVRVICQQCPHPRVLLFTDEEEVEGVVRSLTTDVRPACADAAAVTATPHFAAALQQRHAGAVAPVRPSRLTQSGSDVYVRDNSALCKLNAGELLIGVSGHAMARGLHVQHVTHVLVYGDFPSTASFIHCAGRTGRMGAEGDVIVLFPPSSGRAVQRMCHAVDVDFVAGRHTQMEALLEGKMGGRHGDGCAVTPDEEEETKECGAHDRCCVGQGAMCGEGNG